MSEKMISNALLMLVIGLLVTIAPFSPAIAGDTLFDGLTASRFVRIPGGCFVMGQSSADKTELVAAEGQKKYDKYFGDELPRHRVCVDTFWLAEKEVTVGLWRRFIKATGFKTDAERNADGKEGSYAYKSGSNWKWRAGYYWGKCGFSQSNSHPVTCVSFNDVKKFMAWLNRQGKHRFRLPTEAEWEYACRGGTQTIRFWGNSSNRACAYANVADLTKNAEKFSWNRKHNCSDGYYYTAPVGSFKANPFGLYDMHGNVWEWCADWYGENYYRNSPAKNPQGPTSGSSRVDRGGCWCSRPSNVRAALRSRDGAAYRDARLGFRLAFSSGQ